MARAVTCFVAVSTPEASTLEPAALRHHGRVIAALRGEAAVFGFDAAAPALRFALEARTPARRIGIHATVPPGSGSHAAVDCASRLARTAPRDGILATASLRTRAEAEDATAALRFRDHGRLDLPGAAGPLDIIRIESGARTPATIRFGGFELDPERFELRRDGARIDVEPRTFDLISLLARHAGQTVPRETIFGAVWGDRIVSDAALSSQIRAARRVLGDDGTAQSLIATVHGRGFRLRARALDPPRHTDGAEAASAPVARAAPVSADICAAPANGRIAGQPVVAILPCACLGADGHGAVLAQGLTEDLINALTKHRWLRVITRNPVVALARASGWGVEDAARSPPPGPGPAADGATRHHAAAGIAAQLGADYVVTGSLRRADNRLCVTVQLSEADAMRCLWSERFDREMRDIFVLQEEIAGVVAARIAAELGRAEGRRAARTPRDDRGAWELYALGSAEFYRFTQASNRRCQELMRAAIALDPGFAEAHARLAYAMVLEMVYFEGPIDAARMDDAVRVAEAAVAHDDQEANGFFTLGRVQLVQLNYDRAIDALEHAVALNPCHALSFCGLGDSLAYEGRIPEALDAFDRAIALSPHDPFRWAFMSYRSLAHLFAGGYEEAASWARRATLVPNAHYWAHGNLVAALGMRGSRSAAREAARELGNARPGFTRDFARKRLFFVKQRTQLATFLEGLRRAGVP